MVLALSCAACASSRAFWRIFLSCEANDQYQLPEPIFSTLILFSSERACR